MLEAAPEDIELVDGKYQVRGSPDKSMTMAEISGAAHIPPNELPTDIEPGLEASAFYDPENFVFPFGAHACVVEVDAETGKVKVVRYVAVDDCGPAINPMLIDGQIHGGVVHAIGQALYEQVVYDEEGQLVTGTFVDYALPTAAEIPPIESDRTETPSPVNTLGVKGIGEAGTIAATPAVAAAVLDAVKPLGVTELDMPLTPMRVWQAIQAGREWRRCRMITAPFDYEAPESLEEAIRMLHENGEDAKLLAGGHSLLPLMKVRLATPTVLVDLRRIPGLHGVQQTGGDWRIGPMTRHADLQDVAELGVVARAASLIADQQVRNRGTIGGSLAHGDPASDLPTVLLALDGSVTARGPNGERTIAASELFQDYLTTSLAHDEVITEVRLPSFEGRLRLSEVHPPGRGLGDGGRLRARQPGPRRHVRRRARSGSRTWASTPLRASAAEDALRGGQLDDASIAAAAEQAGEGTDPPGDLNATPEYKRHLARVLTRRALEEAVSV